MNDFLALDISSAGMRVQRQRMRIISENLANQHTTGPDGAYARKEVIFEAVPITEFERELDGSIKSMNSGEDAQHSVVVSEVRQDGADPIKVYDPSHPHADAQGLRGVSQHQYFPRDDRHGRSLAHV